MTKKVYDLDHLEEKLTKAKVILVNHHPFFAVLALGQHIVITNRLSPPTMATDFIRMYAHPAFVDEHSEHELAAVIAHEVLHNAFLHNLRLGDRDRRIANYAMDYAINPIIEDAGMKLPKPNLMDARFKDMSWEEIYEIIYKEIPQMKIKFTAPSLRPENGDGSGEGENNNQGDDQGDKDGNIGGVLEPTIDGRELTDAEKAALGEEMKIMVKQAAENAKAIGKLPGSLQGLVEAVGKPKINWQEYIQNWVKGHKPDDYSFRRPNRRIMATSEIYMPTITMNGSGVGVLSIDTSGSVSDEELREYVREIAGVIELCKPEKVYIIQHDAVIQSVEELDFTDDFSSLKVKGRGGTNISPSFQYATTKIDEQVDWMICFTDMGIGDWPATAPDFPVLWCATGPDCAPFGTYIDLRKAL